MTENVINVSVLHSSSVNISEDILVWTDSWTYIGVNYLFICYWLREHLN